MANPFRTSNPALNEKAFRGEVTLGGEAMTLQGTVNKTGLVLLCVVATSAWTWGLAQSPTPGAATPWRIGGVCGREGTALRTNFQGDWGAVAATVCTPA